MIDKYLKIAENQIVKLGIPKSKEYSLAIIQDLLQTLSDSLSREEFLLGEENPHRIALSRIFNEISEMTMSIDCKDYQQLGLTRLFHLLFCWCYSLGISPKQLLHLLNEKVDPVTDFWDEGVLNISIEDFRKLKDE